MKKPSFKESMVTPEGSPFFYRAPRAGMLSVNGGMVSTITLNRSGQDHIVGATQGLFPLAPHDLITVSYAVPPTMVFFPSVS